MDLRILAAIASCALIVVSAPDAAPAVDVLDVASDPGAPLPQHLRDTGLFDADGKTVRRDIVGFAPQYPLWSNGATKRRWIHLPAGTSIDASQPDAWEFPRGTRLWKEFSQGRRAETRLIERLADGTWRFTAYAWNPEGSDAVLVREDGATIDLPGAPGGRYSIPSRSDCLACHEGAAVPVLGFSALQLSPDRDPLSPHAESASDDHADLRTLVERGMVRNLPRALVDAPPRIAAADPVARAALGYLHANCGHCHNAGGALMGVDMVMSQRVDDPAASVARTLKSLVDRGTRFRSRDTGAVKRLVPGHAEASLISVRMKTTNPMARMPPVGVDVVDVEGAALVDRWIQLAPEEP
jgi:hypothetical protein